MVHRVDQTVTDPYERLEGRIRKLESQLREERAARRLESASIGKGGLTIRDGGGIRLLDQAGNVIGLIGDLSELGAGMKGVWLQRAGGYPAMSVYGTGAGDPGFVGIYDRAGDYVLTDDAQSGRGVARPYIPIGMGEWSTPTVTTTSGTFGDMAVGVGPLQHPVLYAWLLVRSSDATTTGQLRLTVDDAQVGSVVNVAGNFYGESAIGPTPVTRSQPFQLRRIAVQGRRTAGTGTIGVRVLTLLGLESSYA